MTHNDPLSLWGLFRLWRPYITILMGFALVGCVVAICATSQLPQTYTSTAILRVNTSYVNLDEVAYLINTDSPARASRTVNGGILTVTTTGLSPREPLDALGGLILILSEQVQSWLPDYSQRLAQLEERRLALDALLAESSEERTVILASIVSIMAEVERLTLDAERSQEAIAVIRAPTLGAPDPVPWLMNIALGTGAGFLVGLAIVYLLMHPEILSREVV